MGLQGDGKGFVEDHQTVRGVNARQSNVHSRHVAAHFHEHVLTNRFIPMLAMCNAYRAHRHGGLVAALAAPCTANMSETDHRDFNP